MRLMIMFDLPTETAADRSDYAKFHRSLVKEGFIMMQQSIYCKLVMNPLAAELAKQRVQHLSPNKGVIQAMIVTEKQYAQIEYLSGGTSTKQVNSTDRLVIF